MEKASTSGEHSRILGALRSIARTSVGQAAIASSEGGIAAMVSCLQNGTEKDVELSVGTLRDLAANQENHQAIINTGAIPVLVAVARNGTPTQRNMATDCLVNLSVNESNSTAIALGGGVEVLFARIREPESGTGNRSASPTAMSTPPFDDDLWFSNRYDVLKSAVVQTISILLRGKISKNLVINSGMVQLLLALLNDAEDDMKMVILRALAVVPREPDLWIHGRVKEFIPMMIQLVSSDDSYAIRAKAATILAWISWYDKSDTNEIEKLGGIRSVIKLLHVNDDAAKTAAAFALKSFLLNGNIAMAAVQIGALPALLRCMTSSSLKLKIHAIAIISAIAKVPNGAAMLARAGGAQMLLKALPAEVIEEAQGSSALAQKDRNVILLTVLCLYHISRIEDVQAEIGEGALADVLIAIIRHDNGSHCYDAIEHVLELCGYVGMTEKIVAAGGIAVIRTHEFDGRDDGLVTQVLQMLESVILPPPPKRIKIECLELEPDELLRFPSL